MKLLFGIAALLAIFAAIVAVTALAVGAISRDRRHGTSGSLSSAMLNVQSLLEPEKRHAAESIQAEREDGDEDPGGEPPH
ncbi:MAG: hypothetical protein ACXW3E_14485 [Thermoanaerobaculia bacterium]